MRANAGSGGERGVALSREQSRVLIEHAEDFISREIRNPKDCALDAGLATSSKRSFIRRRPESAD
jgi:hypothetical protein